MNTSRIVRCSNILFILVGYQLHWFDAKLQRYRVSLPAVLNTFILACLYAGCFAQHFQPSAVLKTLQDVSPFLYGLTRMHLLLSVKVFGYAIYASVRAVGVANALMESLPTRITSEKGCSKDAFIAFGLLYSTFVVFSCFGLYIAYEMEFKLPPLQDAMIGFALFLPHLVLATALRFYSIIAWLTRDRLRQLDANVETAINASKMKVELEVVAATTSVTVSNTASSTDSLLTQYEQLELLATRFAAFFESLQSSLMLLIGVNGNCLLFGIYAHVYYSSTWFVLFEERKRRVFYASNALIYSCITCDYVCLLLAQNGLEEQRTKFLGKLNSVLILRDVLSKRIRNTIKDMRSLLSNAFQFKLESLWRFNISNFIMLQALQLLIIALVVMYHYLNDAILQLNERLDTSNDDEK